ncbi:diacylglycerol kinase [Sphingomonas bacterium]|uniref:diacylglycerol kinase n=1 Tax=Sphingomonas bacterium TaxID=1895847 RepID=UPI0015750089|nr:diacylglycerol kinase [Sphingomonas bacterium]
MKNRPIYERMGFALAGIREAYAREQSFRIHVRTLAGAILALLVLRPSAIWWAAIAIVAALVLAFEMINSALEGLVDLIHPEVHPEIKVVKDMASGAVLVAGFAAIVVALCLLIAVAPRFLGELRGWIG